MEMKIIKGTHENLKDCEEILLNSDLGKYYFTVDGSARKAIEEGLESGTLYVVLLQGACVGFMYYMPNGAFHSFPYLHLIVVKEECRGNGIGEKFLAYFEHIADKNKYFLVVGDFNSNAKKFYERNGYRQVGEMPGLYRENITEFLMMKEKVD